jgi:hypothetical protein
MLLIHPQFSITSIKLCNCFTVTMGLMVKLLSSFCPLRQLSSEGSLYICSDWVYCYTIQSVINNITMLKGIFNVFYPSTNRFPSLWGIGKPPWSLWLKFTTRPRDLTDNCMCRVQRWGNRSKTMLTTIITLRVSPCNLLIQQISKNKISHCTVLCVDQWHKTSINIHFKFRLKCGKSQGVWTLALDTVA